VSSTVARTHIRLAVRDHNRIDVAVLEERVEVRLGERRVEAFVEDNGRWNEFKKVRQQREERGRELFSG
jgi:hypothetical protein